MQCLQPREIINPKWKKLATLEKRSIHSYRFENNYKIKVPCGVCINCLKTKQSEWRVRLLLEYKYLTLEEKRNTLFVTFTLSDNYVNDAYSNPGKYVRIFTENYRRYFGRSIRHFIVTEFGEKTGRFHYHALLFNSATDNPAIISSLWSTNPPPRPVKRNKKLWDIYWQKKPKNFGFVKVVSLKKIPINAKSSPSRIINYIGCYISKFTDDYIISDDKKQRVFVSPGLGKKYLDYRENIEHFAKIDTDGNYSFNVQVNGLSYPYSLPRYLTNKLVDIFDFKLGNPYFVDVYKTYKQTYLNSLDRYNPPFYAGSQLFDDIHTFCNTLRNSGVKIFLDNELAIKIYNLKNGY